METKTCLKRKIHHLIKYDRLWKIYPLIKYEGRSTLYTFGHKNQNLQWSSVLLLYSITITTLLHLFLLFTAVKSSKITKADVGNSHVLRVSLNWLCRHPGLSPLTLCWCILPHLIKVTRILELSSFLSPTGYGPTDVSFISCDPYYFSLIIDIKIRAPSAFGIMINYQWLIILPVQWFKLIANLKVHMPMLIFGN